MDNLNTHHPASLYEAFEPAEARRIAERLEVHYTPKHGSWLDMDRNRGDGPAMNRRIPDHSAAGGGSVAATAQPRKYETAIRTRGPSGQQPQLFHGMGLKKPRLAPKLNDYHIAATMEDLCKKGILVKLPEPQIGSGYFYYAGQPADPKTFSISFFGGKPSEARKREATAEEERRCIECHHWRIVKRCPGNRYSFLPTEKVEGNRTWYGTKTVKNDDCGSCERCWEDPEKL